MVFTLYWVAACTLIAAIAPKVLLVYRAVRFSKPESDWSGSYKDSERPRNRKRLPPCCLVSVHVCLLFASLPATFFSLFCSGCTASTSGNSAEQWAKGAKLKSIAEAVPIRSMDKVWRFEHLARSDCLSHLACLSQKTLRTYIPLLQTELKQAEVCALPLPTCHGRACVAGRGSHISPGSPWHLFAL